LAESLDLQSILEKVAHLCVPALADWCSFHLIEREKGGQRRVRLVAAAARDPRQEEWPRCFVNERHTLHIADSLARVIDGKRSVALDNLPGHLLDDAVPPRKRDELLSVLRPRSAVYAPLTARGCCFGALLLLRCASDENPVAPDRSLAEELALRCAVAADNATLYKQAQDAIRAREEFISLASHELRTPLTTLTLMLDRFGLALTRQREISPEELSRFVAAMRASVGRLTGMVEVLLDLRHIGDVCATVILEPVDLSVLVRDVVERFRPAAERAGCLLETRGAEIPIDGRWDPMRIEQILTSLLANAVKFGSGKPIEITLQGTKKTARIIVRDHGLGMTPESLARIFEPFERAAPKTSYPGLGLGLFIARQLAEAHGGRIRASSQLGDGATFRVELPRDRLVQ
jgi:signal transduction histidine kinase